LRKLNLQQAITESEMEVKVSTSNEKELTWAWYGSDRRSKSSSAPDFCLLMRTPSILSASIVKASGYDGPEARQENVMEVESNKLRGC
jgi:hypothetical protein